MASKDKKTPSVHEPQLATYQLPLGLAMVRGKLAKLREICRRHRVLSLELFGSAVKESFRPTSDLDFLVRFDQIPLEDYFENFLGFQLSLEQLYGKKVDLLEAQTLKNPFLIESVYKDKVKIYEAR